MIFGLQFAQAVEVVQDSLMNLTEPVVEGINVWDLAVKGGWIMIVLLLLSIVGVYIFCERFSVLRKAMKRNPLFMERINDNVLEDDVKSAINYCRHENTPVSRVVEKGLKNFNLSAGAIRETVNNSANLEIAELEKGMPILSTIAAVAPMIGFLGTVTGMVQAFWQMSNAGNNIDVSLLSGGIYEAMITTVGGLIVGIIALFSYNYLVTMVDKVQNDVEAQMITFMQIVHSKKESIK
ncbi:MAG: MotA/TolQ/ExbB proton channel family protein [Bacteroidaceae bacterium]|nr:MotA/TolQ/ExbB proton channel family protein [Bacteroidaceae bacterium]